jgi:hypothetical protein
MGPDTRYDPQVKSPVADDYLMDVLSDTGIAVNTKKKGH